MPAPIVGTQPWVLRTATGNRASIERTPNAETKTPRSEVDLGAHWGAPEGALGSNCCGAYRIRTCDFHRVRMALYR
jgi:hypothetical protein